MTTAQTSVWKLESTNAPLPPMAPGVPLLGNTWQMRLDPLQYMLRMHRQFGPAFRVKMLSRTFTVLAGLDANKFLQQHGEQFLGSEDLFGEFGRELGSDKFLVAMDGEGHKHQRRIQQRGYSRGALAPHIPKVVEIVRSLARDLQTPKPLLPSLQRMVAEQMAVLTTGIPPGENYEDIWTVLNVNLKSTVLKMYPRAALWMPSYRRAKRGVTAFGQRVLDWHRANPPGEKRVAGLLDDLIAAKDENGLPYSEGALRAAAVGPYFAGIDTVASTVAFMMYALLRDPKLTARATAEADELFSKGEVTMDDLKGARFLQNCVLETLRRYPVAPFTPRMATKPFEFAGCSIPVGERVLVANSLPHHMEEYYPDTNKFDPDRYEGGRKVATSGAFAPYSVGAHACLGAGLAEVQMMLTVAALLNAARLELIPGDFVPVIKSEPLPNLGTRLAIRAVELRQPVRVAPAAAVAV